MYKLKAVRGAKLPPVDRNLRSPFIPVKGRGAGVPVRGLQGSAWRPGGR